MKAKPNQREGKRMPRLQRAGPEPILSRSARPEVVTIDSHRRKLEDGELRHSAQLYSRLVNSVDCIVWEADAKTFQFSFVSPQAERMLGYPAEQWLTPGFWAKHVHPEDVEWCTKFCVDATEHGRDHEFEYRMIAADGRTVWLHDVVSVQMSAEGPKQLTGVMIDVTEKKLAEEALRRSEDRLRDTVEVIPMQIWSASPDGCIDYCNEQCRSDKGMTLDELKGEGWEKTVHPDDLPGMAAAWREAVLNGTPFEQEVRYQMADGRYRWFWCRGAPLRDGDGRIIRWYGTNCDIDDRKRAEDALRESEARFRTIFENAGVGAALVDWQGHPIKSNPALQRMLGFTEEELRNRVFAEFTHPDDIDRDWKLYAELVAGKRHKYEMEKRYLTKDGRVVWGNLIVSQIKNKDGTPADYMVGMVEDITERKHAEQELRNAHDQLTRELAERTRAEAEIVRLSERLIKAQEEERTRIARELHDHLSQQIAALGIALSKIKRQIPADRRQAREQAGQAYDRLLAIGEGIRNLSHELHPVLIEHAGLVAALESYCAEFESLTKVRATVYAEGEFSDVPSNAQLGLYRIAQEALHNVWKHSGEKEAEIRLARIGKNVHMTISDHGVGFDPGQSAREVGLGLVSMRERARLLGGTFKVESRAGQGTAIIADIPVYPAPISQPSVQEKRT